MRWAFVRVALATTSMVALALLIPLALVVGQLAHDRAVTAARDQSAAMVTVLAVTDDSQEILRAILSTRSGANGHLAVHLPGRPVLGSEHATAVDVMLAAGEGRSLTAPAEGGLVYLRTVALASGTAVIEVYIPDAELTRNVAGARLALCALALVLVGISVVTADRLATRFVRAARNLGAVASRFGGGDLSARVEPGGPADLAEAGTAFNAMADRVVRLVDAEREIAADLSHRLRTPLTALRLDADVLPPGPDADRIREAVDSLQRQIDEIILGARKSVTERSTETCDVSEVLTERLTFWSVLAEDHGRSWTVEGTNRPLWVPVAKGELSAAIDAMLGNVFAHTPQGVPFQAVLDVRRRILAVEDGGPGIDDPGEALTRGSSGAGSTGLGLDIIRRVADTTGGSLHIGHSRLGGARVALVFGQPAGEKKPRRHWRSRHRAEGDARPATQQEGVGRKASGGEEAARPDARPERPWRRSAKAGGGEEAESGSQSRPERSWRRNGKPSGGGEGESTTAADPRRSWRKPGEVRGGETLDAELDARLGRSSRTSAQASGGEAADAEPDARLGRSSRKPVQASGGSEGDATSGASPKRSWRKRAKASSGEARDVKPDADPEESWRKPAQASSGEAPDAEPDARLGRPWRRRGKPRGDGGEAND